MRLRTILATAALATTALVSLGGGAAQAAPVGGGAHTMACGYYETGTEAFYGHCGTGRIMIEIDKDWTWNSDFLCVGPGETRLGSVDDYDNAWSIGNNGC